MDKPKSALKAWKSNPGCHEANVEPQKVLSKLGSEVSDLAVKAKSADKAMGFFVFRMTLSWIFQTLNRGEPHIVTAIREDDDKRRIHRERNLQNGD